jgi:hypothetical protein
VVIGVDKPGDLPKLRAAASGAHQVADFLSTEGFEVVSFIDDVGKVHVSDIFSAVNGFVKRGTLEQLVIYFAGHGFTNSYSEYWMLSDAPDNPNEAISLVESTSLAKQTSIPNVVFISDACRSRAGDLRADRVRGSLIFPTSSSPVAVVPDVDVFLATLIGDPSWEVQVATSVGAFEGIFTSCFLEAFRSPDDTMVRTVSGSKVVPNPSLKPYLAREVPKRAQAASISLTQRPDSMVVSSDATFIGHAGANIQHATAAAPLPTVTDVAGVTLRTAGVTAMTVTRYVASDEPLKTASTKSGYSDAHNLILTSRGLPTQVASTTGVIVSGSSVKGALARPGIGVRTLDGDGFRTPALVEVALGAARAASVLVQFPDGSASPVAVIRGYVANLVVDKGGVNNISYVPARDNPMRGAYESQIEQLGQLHAAVGTAARFGVFRFEGPAATRATAASQLADKIRVLKGIDPTLGMYAAYAYDQAGIAAQTRSVRQILRGDLSVDLFDVAMLAGAPVGVGAEAVFPFCPMLSQGWSLLRVKNVKLADAVEAARDHRQASLWTTFGPAGADGIAAALRSGALS